MDKNTIITSGKEYLDIDAYASILAYRELLRSQGQENVYAVSSAKLNESITPYARHLGVDLDPEQNIQNANFIILDLSDPAYFDPIVDHSRIIEIIDHHPGHEADWQNTNVKTTIEPIGAAATLVYEKHHVANKLDQMSKPIAELLMMAILDNTLNFRAKITTDRDKSAYRTLAKIAKVDELAFAQNYFADCEEGIKNDLATAIISDTKTGRISNLIPDIFGQLAIWDGQYALANLGIIKSALNQLGPDWLINVISLKDGHSYLISSNKKIAQTLTKLFGPTPDQNNIIKLPEVWLRKEIVRRVLDHEAN